VASRYDLRLQWSINAFSAWLDDRIGSLWRQRAICANPILFRQTSRRKRINRPRANTDISLYDGIRRGSLWLRWWCLFVAGILRIYGATGWTVWALSGDQRIQHVFKAQRGSIDESYPHVGMDSIWLSDSPNWGWQVCDSLSELIRTHGGSRGGYTVSWRLMGVALVPGQEF